MIGYVTVGTNNFDKACAFYDALFKEMNIGRFMENEQFVAWGSGDDSAAGFSVTKPFDGKAASVGNGIMVAIAAGSQEIVDKVHAKALLLGGTDEGAVGFRGEMPGFYTGYFRDLDGNKLNIFYISKSDFKSALDAKD